MAQESSTHSYFVDYILELLRLILAKFVSTKTEMSPFRRHFHYWTHRKLLFDNFFFFRYEWFIYPGPRSQTEFSERNTNIGCMDKEFNPRKAEI